MDIIVGISLLLCGCLIGYFASRFILRKDANPPSVSEQEIKQLMAQQALYYIDQSKLTLAEMTKQLELMQHQLTDYETFLQQEDDPESTKKLDYFGDQTSTYLRNKQPKPTSTKTKPTSQPLDFSKGSSGLFVGQKQED
jgi:uncharacterized protein YneF (UPF0154 family)